MLSTLLKQNRKNFDNYATVVTFSAYRDFIFCDGQQLTKIVPPTSWKQVEEFSVVSFKISHNFHVVSSSKGSFAAYVYGHSILTSSPSGYGFAANYNGNCFNGSPIIIKYLLTKKG